MRLGYFQVSLISYGSREHVDMRANMCFMRSTLSPSVMAHSFSNGKSGIKSHLSIFFLFVSDKFSSVLLHSLPPRLQLRILFFFIFNIKFMMIASHKFSNRLPLRIGNLICLCLPTYLPIPSVLVIANILFIYLMNEQEANANQFVRKRNK